MVLPYHCVPLLAEHLLQQDRANVRLHEAVDVPNANTLQLGPVQRHSRRKLAQQAGHAMTRDLPDAEKTQDVVDPVRL